MKPELFHKGKPKKGKQEGKKEDEGTSSMVRKV